MKCVAGVDLGTQSMKVVLYDYESKKTVESGSCPMDLISKDDGTREQTTEMYEKGLTLAVARDSAVFLQPGVRLARFLAAGRAPAVHFPAFPAARRSCAVHFPRFLAAGCTSAVHFDQFLAG